MDAQVQWGLQEEYPIKLFFNRGYIASCLMRQKAFSDHGKLLNAITKIASWEARPIRLRFSPQQPQRPISLPHLFL